MEDKTVNKGHLHPITLAIDEIRRIFKEIGFSVAEGPEIETEYYNFDALNVPADHPARDMQDTFWMDPVSEKKLLRTQTSPIQIRYMENNRPPIAIISPGKVYRNEAIDATHGAEFFQVEGFYVDKKVSMADLKGVLEHFFKEFFGPDVEIRFRPSFFPFTEPSVEIDLRYKDRWLEVMGAGLVHPKILESGGIDPKEFSGFAFGGGIERLVMIKYGIDDLRLFYSGDLRVINQF
ncbi:MAG: phenylalanine--tRNA ligase subunit alpha [Candidatus Paceibacterota bacterium]